MDNILWPIGHELLVEDMVRAEGCHLYDAAGRRYVDMEAGMWCAGLGHGHPAVTRVIAEQAGAMAHTGYSYAHPVIEATARELLGITGIGEGKCVFLASGSEAVEFGIRAARFATGRRRLLTLADSYLGAYGAANNREGDEWCRFDWMPCASCATIASCDSSCPRLAKIPFSEITGFVFEPGSSSGLVRFAPEAVIRTIVSKTREAGGLVVANEITTGMGRTGRWFGYQHYGFTPDIVASGKGLGNGYPVSATVIARSVAERLADPAFRYAQSHLNDPLGAAVAGEVIRVMRAENLVERACSVGARLAEGLRGMAARRGSINEVRGRGAMLAVDFAGEGDYRAMKIYRALYAKGYIVCKRPGLNILRMDPCFITPDGVLDGFIHAIDASAAEAL